MKNRIVGLLLVGLMAGGVGRVAGSAQQAALKRSQSTAQLPTGNVAAQTAKFGGSVRTPSSGSLPVGGSTPILARQQSSLHDGDGPDLPGAPDAPGTAASAAAQTTFWQSAKAQGKSSSAAFKSFTKPAGPVVGGQVSQEMDGATPAAVASPVAASVPGVQKSGIRASFSSAMTGAKTRLGSVFGKKELDAEGHSSALATSVNSLGASKALTLQRAKTAETKVVNAIAKFDAAQAAFETAKMKAGTTLGIQRTTDELRLAEIALNKAKAKVEAATDAQTQTAKVNQRLLSSEEKAVLGSVQKAQKDLKKHLALETKAQNAIDSLQAQITAKQEALLANKTGVFARSPAKLTGDIAALEAQLGSQQKLLGTLQQRKGGLVSTLKAIGEFNTVGSGFEQLQGAVRGIQTQRGKTKAEIAAAKKTQDQQDADAAQAVATTAVGELQSARGKKQTKADAAELAMLKKRARETAEANALADRKTSAKNSIQEVAATLGLSAAPTKAELNRKAAELDKAAKAMLATRSSGVVSKKLDAAIEANQAAIENIAAIRGLQKTAKKIAVDDVDRATGDRAADKLTALPEGQQATTGLVAGAKRLLGMSTAKDAAQAADLSDRRAATGVGGFVRRALVRATPGLSPEFAMKKKTPAELPAAAKAAKPAEGSQLASDDDASFEPAPAASVRAPGASSATPAAVAAAAVASSPPAASVRAPAAADQVASSRAAVPSVLAAGGAVAEASSQPQTSAPVAVRSTDPAAVPSVQASASAQAAPVAAAASSQPQTPAPVAVRSTDPVALAQPVVAAVSLTAPAAAPSASAVPSAPAVSGTALSLPKPPVKRQLPAAVDVSSPSMPLIADLD